MVIAFLILAIVVFFYFDFSWKRMKGEALIRKARKYIDEQSKRKENKYGKN